MARPMRPRHAVLHALAIVIALIALVVVFVMSMIVVAVVSVVMALVSMILVSMVVVPMVLRHLMAVIIVAVIFRSNMLLMTHFAVFLSHMLVMAFFAAYLIPFMRPIRHFVPMVFPHKTVLRIVVDGIRMVIFVAVHPRALPRRVIDENHATVPGNAVVSPSPGTIRSS